MHHFHITVTYQWKTGPSCKSENSPGRPVRTTKRATCSLTEGSSSGVSVLLTGFQGCIMGFVCIHGTWYGELGTDYTYPSRVTWVRRIQQSWAYLGKSVITNAPPTVSRTRKTGVTCICFGDALRLQVSWCIIFSCVMHYRQWCITVSSEVNQAIHYIFHPHALVMHHLENSVLHYGPSELIHYNPSLMHYWCITSNI
jgi:hypothetical protein